MAQSKYIKAVQKAAKGRPKSTQWYREKIKESEVIKYSAGGFRDFTRIASSDPIMWRDIFLNNKDAVIEVLGRFIEDLSALQKAIRWDDGEFLEQKFIKTRNIIWNWKI